MYSKYMSDERCRDGRLQRPSRRVAPKIEPCGVVALGHGFTMAKGSALLGSILDCNAAIKLAFTGPSEDVSAECMALSALHALRRQRRG